MNKVNGKVLVKETGVGVPNLLVVIYDVDPVCEPTSFIAQATDQGGNRRENRIGSVLTDASGNFELTFDDAIFAPRDPERRPDLVLGVFAPEDSISTAQLIPLPPQQRLLLLSNIPRQDSGQTEAYILRISRELLEKFEISIPQNTGGLPDKESVIASITASFDMQKAIRNSLAQLRAPQIQQAKESLQRAKKVFQNFNPSSVPKELRADATYFSPGDKLEDSQAIIASRDIDRLSSLGKKNPIRLKFKMEDVEQLSTGGKSKKISLKNLYNHIEEKNKGGQFLKAKSTLSPCMQEKEATEIINKIKGDDNPKALVSPNSDNNALNENQTLNWTAETLVNDLIARHMEHVASPEAQLVYGIPDRAGQEDIANTINTIDLKGGPSDVTSYHDFHNLTIAFEHIWKEEIDKSLKGWGSEIFQTWINIKQEFGVDADEDEVIETFDEFKNIFPVIEAEQKVLEEQEEVPWEVTKITLVTQEQWGNLSPNDKVAIFDLVMDYQNSGYLTNDFRKSVAKTIQELINNNERKIAETKQKQQIQKTNEEAERKSAKLKRLLTELRKRLSEAYKFDVFAPNSVNYGILTTYRQEWKPLSYQVGELVSTIPLAPKEVRRYSKKQVVKKSRSRKEIEDSLRIIKRDSSDTKRADAEIVDKANNKTNFKASAEGSGKLGGFAVKGSTGLETDAEKSSSQTKKDFREAVLKASEEYKQERRLEVEDSTTNEFEETSSGEISNPNDELTVTYMFYELQRRYEIREQIHRLTPVILVANEVPAPHDIDEDWLIAHDWILKRVMLDDSFLSALDALKRLTGLEFALEVLRANLERQSKRVDELQSKIEERKKKLDEKFQDVQDAMSRQARVTGNENTEGVFENIGEALFGERGGDEDPDAERIRVERAKAAFDQIEREYQQLQSQMNSEASALESATKEYATALQEHLDRRTDISRLRIHVKDNILYYMQAIWEHEPPDQRYFRLYNKKAIWLPIPDDVDLGVSEEGQIDVDFNVWQWVQSVEWKTLVEIADLDNLMGFKGNYMIFPLKQNNLVGWYMMQPYLSDIMGLKDPDEFDNYTTEELIENFRCLYSQYPNSVNVQEWYQRILDRLTAPRREKDIVIVPTDSLYIEALPGKHPLLEDFKLMHRALDVKKVQAEVRHAELENVRIAARLLSGEREDPDIDKKIVVEGEGAVVLHNE